MIDDFEAVEVVRIVDRTDICNVVEGRDGVVVQEGGDVLKFTGQHLHGELRALRVFLSR